MTLEDLATLAAEGKTDELLLGLAKRADERERKLYEKAVATFDHLTDNPKSSLGAAENAGATRAGPIPDDSDVLVSALIELSRSRNGHADRA